LEVWNFGKSCMTQTSLCKSPHVLFSTIVKDITSEEGGDPLLETVGGIGIKDMFLETYCITVKCLYSLKSPQGKKPTQLISTKPNEIYSCFTG